MNVDTALIEIYRLIDFQFNSFTNSLTANKLNPFEISSRVSEFKCEINTLKSEFILKSFETQGYEIGKISENDYSKIQYAITIIPLKVDSYIQKSYNEKIIPIQFA